MEAKQLADVLNVSASYLLCLTDSPDGAYDESPVYDKLSAHSPSSNIVIQPAKNAVVNSKAHQMINRNIWEIKEKWTDGLAAISQLWAAELF